MPSSQETPKDGNCLFHAIAQGLSSMDGNTYDQQHIRNMIADYLRQNPYLPSGDHLQEFVQNRDWNEYLDGISESEWGDHICILAAVNLFNVRVVIASSQNGLLQDVNPWNNIPQDRVIYLGHEFEVHYIRLDNLDDFNLDYIPEERTVGPTDLITDITETSHMENRGQSLEPVINHSVDEDEEPKYTCVNINANTDNNKKSEFECLPKEIKTIIFKMAINFSAIYIGILNRVCSSFLEIVQSLSTFLPQLHINESILARLLNTSDTPSIVAGRQITISVPAMSSAAGPGSGLTLKVKELLSAHPRWFNGFLTLEKTSVPGWFILVDFFFKQNPKYF